MSKVDKTLKNAARCRCLYCPTYTFADKIKTFPDTFRRLLETKGDISKHEHLESMYCAYEKSNYIDEEKGCLCGECPVHKDYDLKNMYFCQKTGGK